MPRGRPKKKNNMSSLELYEALKAEREKRKHDLHKQMLPEEREAIQRLKRVIINIRESYYSLSHPFYDDIVEFDNASRRFDELFGESNGFDAT